MYFIYLYLYIFFTLKKLECLKQTLLSLNSLAWDNRIRLCFFFYLFNIILLVFKNAVMINRNGRGYWYFIVRGEILRLMKDPHKRKHLPRTFPLIKNESLGIEDD